MSHGRYLEGVIALVCVLGSLGVGAVAVRIRLLPAWRGALAWLAEAVIALALLVGMIEVLGTFSLFKLVPLVIVSILLGGGLRLWLVGLRTPPAPDADPELEPPPHDWGYWLMLAVALLAAVALIGEWLGPSLSAFDSGIVGADSVWYHLPHAASYAQTGNVVSVRYTDVDYLTGYYPATAELFHALGMVLMGSDVLSPGINLLWLVLALFAAWCLGAPRGLGPTTLMAGAIVLALPSLVFTNAGSADTDVPGVFFVVAAAAIWMHAVRLARADGPPGEKSRFGLLAGADVPEVSRFAILLAGVAGGLAVSVKLNLGGPILAMTIVVILAARGGTRWRTLGLWLAGCALGGGYWLLRNLIAVGNPLPWFGFGILSTPQPPPLQHNTNYSILSYATYPNVITKSFEPSLAKGFGPWWAVILIVGLVGPLLCAVLGRTRVVRLLGLAALLAVIAYPLTPLTACGPFGHPIGFHDNLRYAAAALTLGLATLAMAGPLTGRVARLVVFAGMIAIFVFSIAHQRLWNSAYALAGPGRVAALILVIALVAFLRPWSHLRSVRALVPKLGIAVAAAVLGLSGVAVAYTGQRDYVHDRYTNKRGLFGIHQLWHWGGRLQHQRIALAGTFGWYFGYPLWGNHDNNAVVYMGQTGPGGSYRTYTSCVAWRTAINAGHFDYVVTTAKRTMWSRALSYSPEGDWTRTSPSAKPVFKHRTARAVVQAYKLSGPLDPAQCATLPHHG